MKIFSLYLRYILLITLGSFLITGCQNPTLNDKTTPDSRGTPTDYNEANAALLVENIILKQENLEPTENNMRYNVGSADLNNDGQLEILVLMQTQYFCGSGGCSAYLFNNKGRIIHRMTVTSAPILLSRRMSEGWKIFYVWSEGALREIRYQNGQYPANPSLAKKYNREPELKAARYAVQTSEVYQQDGYELKFVRPSTLFQDVHTYQFSFRHYGDPASIYWMTIDMILGSEKLNIEEIK